MSEIPFSLISDRSQLRSSVSQLKKHNNSGFAFLHSSLSVYLQMDEVLWWEPRIGEIRHRKKGRTTLIEGSRRILEKILVYRLYSPTYRRKKNIQFLNFFSLSKKNIVSKSFFFHLLPSLSNSVFLFSFQFSFHLSCFFLGEAKGGFHFFG